MKILTNRQIREADAYTIKYEPIASIDLMERAAYQLYKEYVSRYTVDRKVIIIAGPGNNGGDGIALARMLVEKGYLLDLYLFKTKSKYSDDARLNFDRLPDHDALSIKWLEDNSVLPEPDAIIIDALFGSGLSRPLDGFAGQLVDHINSLPNTRIAIDIPSGLFSEFNGELSSRPVIKADYTWCFQFPKLAFLMPENEQYVGQWKHLDIGLHPGFITRISTPYYYLSREMVGEMILPRKRFSHKGDFGHAMLISGSSGKMGAAVLAARSCLRSGVGLLTVHVPAGGMTILQTAVPEAMVSLDSDNRLISSMPDSEPYTAIGIGPGIGQDKKTAIILENILHKHRNIVLDADALNILASNTGLLGQIPPGTIITPHPGEYKRLFGPDDDHYRRLSRMREIAVERRIIIVLKGANTAIADPEGNLWFNSTGNPGMATAGSGDVLTGIILSLLAQGYEAAKAALIGVFIHGLAGDNANIDKGNEGLIAGDIIESLPYAFKSCSLK